MSTARTRTLGNRGLDLIKSYETLRLEAYMPTPNDKPTIGYGSTRGVVMGMVITEEEAERRLRDDCAEAIAAVSKLPNVHTQSMFDALVSLVFNAGAGAVDSGTTIWRELHAGDVYAAWAAFTLWRKQRNRVTGKLENVRGLAKRRADEMRLYMEDRLP